MLQYPAYINRIYVHAADGRYVQVARDCGSPRPGFRPHARDLLLQPRTIDLGGARRKTTVALGSGAKHEFWELPLKPTNPLSGSPLRVFYAWSTGTKWEAADAPALWIRRSAASVQAANVRFQPSRLGCQGFRPAQDFLTEFLNHCSPGWSKHRARSGSSCQLPAKDPLPCPLLK